MVDPFIHIYLYVYNGGGSVIKFVATLCNSGRSLLAPLHILFTYSWRYSSKFLWRREKYWWGWWRAAYDFCFVDCTRGFVFLELCIVKLRILTDDRATTSLANKHHRILSFISQNISKQPQMRSIHTSVMEANVKTFCSMQHFHHTTCTEMYVFLCIYVVRKHSWDTLKGMERRVSELGHGHRQMQNNRRRRNDEYVVLQDLA